jgi:hypothetical protein
LRIHLRSKHGAVLWADITEATAASMLPFPFLPTRMILVWIHPPRQDKVRSMLIFLFAFFEGRANFFLASSRLFAIFEDRKIFA